MARYKVTVVSPGIGRPVLVVPFQPDALVTAFIDELFKRIARLDLQLQPDTHIATLHLDSETGAILDCDDLLSDVIGEDEKDKLFMVVKEKNAAREGDAAQTPAVDSVQSAEGFVRVRVTTAARARDKLASSAPNVIEVPRSMSLKGLHETVASHLGIRASIDRTDMHECNCKLASKLVDDPQVTGQVLVIHGKSEVQRLTIAVPTEIGIQQALRSHFGVDLETRKKVVLLGGERDMTTPSLYKHMPVVAICSKQRHVPVHARVDTDDSYHDWSKVLDLHCTEQPIHPACADVSIEDSGILETAKSGVLDIFAVVRSTSGANNTKIGKNAIYRTRSHWHPEVVQSNRGMAMFLSSLRVFVSLIQDMKHDERAQDAVLHVLDLLTGFPPALRTLYILLQDKTPSPTECAALSQAFFQLLDSFMPIALVGPHKDRLFEGSRLIMGFILENAKALKLSGDHTTMPYLSALQTYDLRDFKTLEPTFKAVSTNKGLVEKSLFEAYDEQGLLARSRTQDFAVKIDADSTRTRMALISGGLVPEIATFVPAHAQPSFTYRDAGDVSAAIDLSQLQDLPLLAEMSGRNKLAVHRPSQLSSSETPCLTFDSQAHLSVYLGEEGCALPGKSSQIFRPLHGQETVDTSLLEQSIAATLREYEANGTAVFDAMGGAAVRRFQAPEEIVMFCVDNSASMRADSEFDEEAPEPVEEPDARALIAPEHYTVTLDDTRDRLCDCEGFHDMIAIVAEATSAHQRQAAVNVIQILRGLLSTQILKQTAGLEDVRQRAHRSYFARNQADELETRLEKAKSFFAGLQTHEVALQDFLLYRAQRDSAHLCQKWTWSLSDPVATTTAPAQLPTLADDITQIPDELRCPISHTLMSDAVAASDGFVYARPAITEWFKIRQSSPMTGLPLDVASLESNQNICDAAARWVQGLDFDAQGSFGSQSYQLPMKRERAQTIFNITFDSREGSFTRPVSPDLSLKDLYKVAFRGLRGRHSVFQLSTERYGPLRPVSTSSVTSARIVSGTHVSIQIAEIEGADASGDTGRIQGVGSNDACLVKVFASNDEMAFAFWTSRNSTSQTMETIIWKYWRNKLSRGHHFANIRVKAVWTDLEDNGDGRSTGWPRETTDRLATYLNPNHCSGNLVQEKVYRDNDAAPFSRSPLVLKVKINDYTHGKRKSGRLTRLAVLQQMFEALINRIIAYKYRTHVGLVTVRTVPQISMAISHVLENLRRATNDMKANGDTALFDGLALCKTQLIEYGKKYPEAAKRIICISDGEDTKSISNNAATLCWQMQEANIAVDSVALGDEDNDDLRTISHMLGCYVFEPKSLVNALAMCELDPFLSLSERPAITPPAGTPRAMLPFISKFRLTKYLVRPTVVSEDRVPNVKEHQNVNDEFMPLAVAGGRPISATTGSAQSKFRITRLMNEIKALVGAEQQRKYDIYVSETNMAFWKIVMEGPAGSPYEGGTFLLWLSADDGYPMFAPKARFITKIRHPNISLTGRICMSVFDRDWTRDISMRTLLDMVYGLLLQPEHSDPVNTTITLGYHHDEVEFADQVRAHVKKHAKKTREAWRAEILGEVAASEDGEDVDEDEMDEDEMDEYDEPLDDSDLDGDDFL